MTLSKEQDILADKLSYIFMYVGGLCLLLFCFELKLKFFLTIFAVWVICSAFHASGKEKALNQLKQKYEVEEIMK